MKKAFWMLVLSTVGIVDFCSQIPAQAQELAVWVVDPHVKVFRDTLPPQPQNRRHNRT